MKTLLILLLSISSFNLFAEDAKQAKVEERLDAICKNSPQGRREAKVIPVEVKKEEVKKVDKEAITK